MTGHLNSVKMAALTMAEARYHHGDLRSTLLREAEAMLREQGIEGLTLRKLADRAGVRAPALYHHFEDKHDLLCALAEDGFRRLETITISASESPSLDERERMRRFVLAYVVFARERPETYDLMFGRTIWKAGAPTEALREVAYGTFRRYLQHAIPEGERGKRALRIAQVSWATLHGLCRLLTDGIYPHDQSVAAMCEEVVESLADAQRRMRAERPARASKR